MRFLFLSLGYHPDLPGGAYRYAAEIAQGLAARGHRVEVICPNPANQLSTHETRLGVRLCRHRNASGFFALNWLQENRWARQALLSLQAESPEPALLGVHQAYYGPCLSVLRAPIAYVFHGPWGQEYLYARQRAGPGARVGPLDALIARVMCRVERYSLRRARKILVLSQYSAQSLPLWHGPNLPPIEVVSCGVDPHQFRPPQDRLQLRRNLGLPAEVFLFLTVRRLDPRMGLAGLVRSFASIADGFPHARLWLAGRGPQAAQLRSLVEGLGLADRVRLLGYVPEPDLARFYGAADCTVMPSLDLEGFGLATVESLACGTPVLGSRSGGTPEILAPLGESLLVPPGSEEQLAARMREFLSGVRCLPARGTCAEYARGTFSWDRPVAAWERAFRELHGAANRP